MRSVRRLGLRLGCRLSRLPLREQLLDLALGLGVARFRLGRAARARPGGGVGQLFLDLVQLRFGSLDPLLQPGRLLRRLLGRRGGAVLAALAAAVGRRGLRRGARRRLALVAPPLVLGPAAGWLVSLPSSQTIVRLPTASSSARSWEIRTTAPSNSISASSSASRLSMSRWLVGSSRTRTLAPEATRIASESRRCSPPEMSESCFSTSSPEKRKPPSSARAFGPVRPVSRWAASSTVPSPAAVSACWER